MAIALSPFVNVPDFGTVMSCLISPKFMPGGGESPVGSGNRLSWTEKRSGGKGPFVVMLSPFAIDSASFLNSWIYADNVWGPYNVDAAWSRKWRWI